MGRVPTGSRARLAKVANAATSRLTWNTRALAVALGPKPGSSAPAIPTGVRHFNAFRLQRQRIVHAGEEYKLGLPVGPIHDLESGIHEGSSGSVRVAVGQAGYDEMWDFIRYLHDEVQVPTAATIQAYVGEVRKHVGIMNGAEPPLSLQCSAWFQRARAQSAPQLHKDPATVQLLSAIVGDTSLSLGVRAAVACQWFSVLRLGQLVTRRVRDFDADYDVLRSDVEFDPEGRYMRLLLKRGKTDVFNKGGARFLLPARDSHFCPLTFMRQYLVSTAGFEGDQPLFRHADGRYVTRAHVVQAIKLHARRLGLDPERYAAHSIRIGAATELRASGVSISDIQLIGGWATAAGCLRYMQLTLSTAQSAVYHLRLQQDLSQEISNSDRHVVLPTRARLRGL